MRSHRSALPILSAVVGLISISPTVLAQSDFYLKNGDRVVFYGDSITDQRLYTTFAETFVVTRFPKLNIKFTHSGWGGDRVTGGGGGPIDMRLERDVFAYNPTVMTVMLGMNDGSYRLFDDGIFNTYARGYEHIIQSVTTHQPGIRMTLIQPSPYDDVTRAPGFPGGYNAVLLKYSDFVKDIAVKNKLDTADLNNSVVDALKVAQANDPAGAAKIIADRVHPGPGGHLLMAEALLKAWKAPKLVSSVDIDATSKKVTSANTKVSDIQYGSSLSWTQMDNALPMPIDFNDAATKLSIKSSDFIESLNQQPLKVSGLSAARYALKIDGMPVGEFSNSELSSGINLAVLSTPMVKQAAQVHALTLKHNNIHFLRWRNVQVPMQNDKLANMPKALAGLDAIEADVVAQQHAAAMPVSHKFELTPQ